ncbi:hypothetical protein TNCV_3913101 [Trichonephila clavipes]|nr:hypothetical protein TNCV_3913101 [Trichonephila clavipes]
MFPASKVGCALFFQFSFKHSGTLSPTFVFSYSSLKKKKKKRVRTKTEENPRFCVESADDDLRQEELCHEAEQLQREKKKRAPREESDVWDSWAG